MMSENPAVETVREHARHRFVPEGWTLLDWAQVQWTRAQSTRISNPELADALEEYARCLEDVRDPDGGD